MGILCLRADLHNHSCLSPCGDLSMSPSLLAETASSRGVEVLALTDHNASLNCPAFAISCARAGLVPLFGLELCSAEEVHLLALFPTPRKALEFGAAIHDLIPGLPWDPASFGDQVVVDEEENVLELHGRWLGAALDAPLDDLVERARLAGAIVIPAHVDRAMFSAYSQLGFLPPGPYDAVESLGPIPPSLSLGLSVISGSDAHYPEHIGRRPTVVELPEEGVIGLRQALGKFAKGIAAGDALGEVGDPLGAVSDPLAAAASPAEENFGGYAELLADPRLDAYPREEAEAFFENLREALKAGNVVPTHVARPIV